MMKRNCAAYGSYYNVSTQSFLWRKLFHGGSQAFIFLPEKCFNHIAKVWFLAVTRFLQSTYFNVLTHHFLEHMSSCGSTQVLPFGGKRIDFIHEYRWVLSVNTTQLKTPKRYPFHQTLFQTWIYQRDFHTDQEKWNRSITSF